MSTKRRTTIIPDNEFPGMPSGNLADSARMQAAKPPEGTTVAVGRMVNDTSKKPIINQK